MKYFELLGDVELMDTMTGELWTGPDGRQPTPIVMTHKQYLRGRLCDLAWGQTFARGKQQDNVAVALDQAHVYVAVEDADHVALCDTVRTPNAQQPYNPNIMRSVMSFGDAVLSARGDLPDEWAQAEQEARDKAAEACGDEAPKSDEKPPSSPPAAN